MVEWVPHPNNYGAMHDDERFYRLPAPDPPPLDPIFCELANGHTVKFETRFWNRVWIYEEWAFGILSESVFEIRIYCTQDTYPKRLVRTEKFKADVDFDIRSIQEIWLWISDFCKSRAVFDFDDFESFVSHIASEIGEISHPESNAMEHYEDLQFLSVPAWFDRIDDSIFTDQHDTSDN
jgi:hypothetical protein